MKLALCQSLLISCLISFDLVADSAHSGFEPLMRDDGTTLPEARGTWRADGYGLLLRVLEREYYTINACSAGAWREPHAEGPELFFQHKTDSKECQVSMHPLVTAYNVRRIDDVPDTRPLHDDYGPAEIFELFAATMADYYAFFQLRDIDWEGRVVRGRQQLSESTTEVELFEICEGMLKGLDDAHTYLVAEIDGLPRQTRFGESKTIAHLRNLFAEHRPAKDFGAFMEGQLDSFRAGVLERTLSGDGKVAAKRIQWGRIGDVGYMFIPGMGGFSEAENASLERELTELHDGMDQMLTALADTKAIIIDVSLNGGGTDIYGQAIACHFADQKRLAGSKYPFRLETHKTELFISPQPHEVNAAADDREIVTYTKPVYVVTSPVSVSAAESFVMYLQSLPRVKVVGEPTRGALSDVLEKTLPNGWQLGLSNEIYLNHNGECLESVGITPDLPRPVFKIGIGEFTNSDAILALASMIEEQQR